jgi:hypothetical protein
MPSYEIMPDFEAGKLYRGRNGPIVKSKKQAKAIQLSYLRKEGHDIPERPKRMSRSYHEAKH